MQLKTVSIQQHAAMMWQKPTSYEFARTHAVVPLVASEVPKAALAAPVGLLQTDAGFMPVMLSGLEAGKNLFIAKNGHWLCDYLPVILRYYPFHLVEIEAGQTVLCVDEDSGLVGENIAAGKRFFADDGQLTDALHDVINALISYKDNRLKTKHSCEILAQYAVLEPWPITHRNESGFHTMEGLFRINEAQLKALSAQALAALHAVDALALAYCQLISTHRMQTLLMLAKAHADIDQRLEQESRELFALEDEGELKF
ncbi:SapC family protein [Thiorhodospira sibirica]|uniref:SapC family protein n=1 Tax=Thiorhodospira sibirica TaxID=154347 RepID=UPI00022C115E|nr:SapC family protein [Thiorhodospira sibirica]